MKRQPSHQEPPEADGSLAQAVQVLLELAPPDRRPAAEALLTRVEHRRLRVVVAGEAKRGKSTLLNRLFDREILPCGVLPVTAVTTTVRYAPGASEQLKARYLDGRIEIRPVSELPNLVTESGNPHNQRGVEEVELQLDRGPLDQYSIELVDTPGTGSIFTHNTRAAEQAYSSLDAVIVVLTVDPPISAAERELLRAVSASAVRTFVILNKADRLSADELAEATAFTQAVCAEAGAAPDPLWVMSARQADRGFHAFQAALRSYLDSRAEADAERALRGHAARLAQELLDQVTVTLRTLDLVQHEDQTLITAFARRLAAVEVKASEMADRCHARERRLLRTLDQSARELTPGLARRTHDRLRNTLDALPPGPSAADVEQQGRPVLESTVVDEIDAWRVRMADRLDHALHELTAELNADVERDIGELRAAAAQHLGVTLTAPANPVRLREGRPFWYALDRPPAWEPPGTELLRRHSFGAARRARVRLATDIHDLVDRQVGRARADLQQRLAETMRALLADLRRGHQDLLRQTRAALEKAAVLADAREPDLHRERAVLEGRRASLTQLIRQLVNDDRV